VSLWPPHNRPPACEGCPRNVEGRSEGFVPGGGRLDAALAVVGEQPGANEVQEGAPFVGKSGKELNVGLGSLGRDGAFVTNVRKCLGRGEETAALREASIAHCVAAYLQPEFDALVACRAVLAVGADALQVVVGPRQMIKWHGAVMTREEADASREGYETEHDDIHGDVS